MNQEEFVTRKPKKTLLCKYISYYYFHNIEASQKQTSFIYYPGIKNALTIYKNSKVEFGKGYSSVEPDSKQEFIFIYSGIQTTIRKAYITAPFQKIGIVFNELGINHFIDIPFSIASPDPIEKSFNYFGIDLEKQCKKVYEESDIGKKVNLLDQFFEAKFSDLMEPILKKCVSTIIDSPEKLTVNDLSKQFNVSRRTLLRLFNKHLSCSVKDYIDIVQFRKALNTYLLEKEKESMTEIALENDYYDQSQFINHFKKLTGINPKKFFKDVKHVGEEDTFWTFE